MLGIKGNLYRGIYCNLAVSPCIAGEPQMGKLDIFADTDKIQYIRSESINVANHELYSEYSLKGLIDVIDQTPLGGRRLAAAQIKYDDDFDDVTDLFKKYAGAAQASAV